MMMMMKMPMMMDEPKHNQVESKAGGVGPGPPQRDWDNLPLEANRPAPVQTGAGRPGHRRRSTTRIYGATMTLWEPPHLALDPPVVQAQVGDMQG